MAGEQSGNGSVRDDFNRQQQVKLDSAAKEQREREEAALMKALNTQRSLEPPDTSSEGGLSDIGNFFRVIAAWVVGVWNGDMADFDMLSKAYFPPVSEDDLAKEDNPDTPPEQREALKTRRQLVNGTKELTDASRNPGHPLRAKSFTELIEHFKETIPAIKKYTAKADFNDIVEIFLPWEGNGKIGKEPLGGIAKYGINSKAHPEINVAALTREQAKAIYLKDYWKPIDWSIVGGEGKASAAVKLIAFDTSAQYHPITANELLKYAYEKSGHNIEKMPEIMLQWRKDRYDQNIKDRPQLENNRVGWYNRLNAERAAIARFDMMTPTDVLIGTPPVDLKKYASNDSFGERNDPFSPSHKEKHRGSDYSTPAGTPLVATEDATVVFTKTEGASGGYGNMVALKVAPHVYKTVNHLSKFNVVPGQTVHKGETYAFTGNTGHSTAPHLHEELWIERNGTFYVVNERLAFGKNLNDPAVQDMLIKDAQTNMGDKVYASMSNHIPSQFLDNISLVTGQLGNGTGVGGAATGGPNIFRR